MRQVASWTRSPMLSWPPSPGGTQQQRGSFSVRSALCSTRGTLPMSLSRLDTRVAHLEARRTRNMSPSELVVVWMADRDTHAMALQRAGLTSAAVSDRTILFVQYEGEHPN